MADVQNDLDDLDVFDEFDGQLPTLEEILMSVLDDPVCVRVEGEDDP